MMLQNFKDRQKCRSYLFFHLHFSPPPWRHQLVQKYPQHFFFFFCELEKSLCAHLGAQLINSKTNDATRSRANAEAARAAHSDERNENKRSRDRDFRRRLCVKSISPIPYCVHPFLAFAFEAVLVRLVVGAPN